MATSFHFKYEGKDFSGTFSSTDGEEYTVKYGMTPRDYYGGKSLIIEWKEVSSKYIRVIRVDSFYQEECNPEFQASTFAKDKKTARIKVNNVCNGSTIVIIISTCTHLSEYQPPVAKGGTITQKSVPKKPEATVEKKLEQLSTDMKNLLQTGNLSDVVLTDGSKEIRAHKLILSVRSSVFAKMFQHPMKENQESRITINDISSEVLRELLHFMYAGTVVIKDSNMARELYVAADKYDVKDLRSICSTKLKSVDLDSVLDTLLLSDLYSDKVLKEAALNFISKNYSHVKVLQKWSNFMKEHQGLALEVLSFVIDKKN